ncbi:MAG: hypothetical protein WCN21_14665 [Comamonadaceae bacterium]
MSDQATIDIDCNRGVVSVTTTEQRLMGEAQVLRELLTEALGVINTISDETESDEWLLLMQLKGRIECALNPSTEGELL